MLKKQKNLPILKRKIKEWIKKNKAIDVILFGSAVRGKYSPGDIDLCILIKDEYEEKSIDLVHSLSKVDTNFQVNILTEKDLIYNSSLTKTLIEEGISITKDKAVAGLFGYKAKSVFLYTLKDFNRSKRVRFHYALQGRGDAKGILEDIKGEFLGNGAIEVPVYKEDAFSEFLRLWEVKFAIRRCLI